MGLKIENFTDDSLFQSESDDATQLLIVLRLNLHRVVNSPILLETSSSQGKFTKTTPIFL
jgi:hypothetical protein